MGYFEDNKKKILPTPGGELCQVFGAYEQANVSIALVKMFANNKGEYHYHDNITEIYVFSKGSGKIIINGIEQEISGGDVYVIPPKNGHLILADSEMEFECICNPPWEEKHEFIIPEGNIISTTKIQKKPTYGKIATLNNGGEILIESLKKGEKFQADVDNNYVEVYYFQTGDGSITIDGEKRKIHNAECFLINPSSKVLIHAESNLVFSIVKDKNMISSNKKTCLD